MGMYNLNFTGSMPPTIFGGSITFFENIYSQVDIPNSKYLIALCRSRNTNITRAVLTYPINGNNDIENPIYNANSRYWEFRITFMLPTAGLRATYDNANNRRLSLVFMPLMDTIDIDLYYGDTPTFSFSQLTKIEGTNIVVNLTVDENYLHVGDIPISYYTQYNDNDVIPIIPSDDGQPASDQEELNAQYGTSIYQV
jgi:hypothetical protein